MGCVFSSELESLQPTTDMESPSLVVVNEPESAIEPEAERSSRFPLPLVIVEIGVVLVVVIIAVKRKKK